MALASLPIALTRGQMFKVLATLLESRQLELAIGFGFVIHCGQCGDTTAALHDDSPANGRDNLERN